MRVNFKTQVALSELIFQGFKSKGFDFSKHFLDILLVGVNELKGESIFLTKFLIEEGVEFACWLTVTQVKNFNNDKVSRFLDMIPDPGFIKKAEGFSNFFDFKKDLDNLQYTIKNN